MDMKDDGFWDIIAKNENSHIILQSIRYDLIDKIICWKVYWNLHVGLLLGSLMLKVRI